MTKAKVGFKDAQNLAIKLAPSLLILLFAYHFLSTKASTLLYFWALLFLIIAQFTEISPQNIRSSISNNIKIVSSIGGLCLIIAFHGQITLAAKILVILLSSVLLLELVGIDDKIRFDRSSIVLYLAVFMTALALSIIELQFTDYLYDLISYSVKPHFYNGLTLLLAIMVPTIVQGTSLKVKSLLLASLALWAYFILISACESAQIVLLLSPLVILLHYGLKRAFKYVVCGYIIAMPVIVNLAFWLTEYFQAIQHEFWASSTIRLLVDRIIIWHSYYMEYGGTLIGVGPNILKRVHNPNVYDLFGSVMTSHPHNAILQVHVELGIIGALFVAFLVFMAFKKAENLDAKYRNAAVICISLCVISRVSTYSLWSTHAYALMFAGYYMSKLFIDHIREPFSTRTSE